PVASREVAREADMKFAGQVFEVMTRLPAEPLTEDLKDDLRARFVADYEREFGSGTAWTEAEILVTNVRMKGIGRLGSAGGAPVRTVVGEDAGRSREIVEPMTGERRTVAVHRGIPLGEHRAGP